MSSDVHTIPVELSHLTSVQRIEAAFWAIDHFGNAVAVARPFSKRVADGPNLCNEIMFVPCFWFTTHKDANWFLLRWSA